MGGGRVDLKPWQVVSDSAAIEQRAAAATSEILAAVNGFGMPTGSTSPHGALIAGQIAGIIPAVTPQVVRTQQQQRAIDDATKHGAKIVVDRDTEGGELFRSEEQQGQQIQQIGQMASQAAGAAAQAPAQAAQTSTQSAQQVGQTAGQGAQQAGQAVSQMAGQRGSTGSPQTEQQGVGQDGDRSKNGERTLSKPLQGAGSGGVGGTAVEFRLWVGPRRRLAARQRCRRLPGRVRHRRRPRGAARR